jgi:2-dehydropantoate 2-reductase
VSHGYPDHLWRRGRGVRRYQTMKILVVGAGSVGCYFGSLLALRGHHVTFGVRSNAEGLRRSGVRAEGPRGDWAVAAHAESDPERVGETDIALICVKLYATESAVRQWKPALARSTAIVSLQNGLDGVDRIAAEWGGEVEPLLLRGLAFMSGTMLSAGHLRYTSNMSSIQFGGANGREAALLAQFTEACRDAGFAATTVEDIVSAQWAKFVALATNAATTCLTRQPAGVCYHDELLVDLAKRSIAEVVAVGRAAGAKFPCTIERDSLALLQSFPAHMYASMYHDLQGGKRLELDGLSGHVVRSGQAYGIDTPFHQTAWACLRPYVDGKESV